MDLKELRKDFDKGIIVSKVKWGALLSYSESLAMMLEEVTQKLLAIKRVEKIAQPECKYCGDTGSLSKSLDGQYDCHHCGRADENVRVIKWYEATMMGCGTESDVLNIYYHGQKSQAERITQLEREVAANRQQIAQLERELSAERMVHGATKRLKEQLDAQLKSSGELSTVSPVKNEGIEEIDRLALRRVTMHFNNFIASCIDASGEPVPPSKRELAKAKACLPRGYSMSFHAPSPADNGGGNGN